MQTSMFGDEIRGLTLWNPMAWAISDFSKRIENRPWKPWNGVRRIAIHAGARYHQLHADQIFEVFGVRPPTKKELPSSKIVAVADLLGWTEHSTDPWFSGPFGWILDHVIKLPEPVPCMGSLGLWRLPPDVLNLVEQQLRKAA